MSDRENKGDAYSYIQKVWITTGIVAFAVVSLLLLEATFSVFLLIFAGILIAVFFRGLSGLIQRKARWNEKVCVGISVVGSLAAIVGFFRSTFGVFGDLYILLFVGIFLTVAPRTYVNGIVELVPIKGQAKAKRIFQDLGEQLRNWLKGTLMSMFVVFVLTAIGLAILGIPLWLVLALLAGLLSFIPNFGPILALIPAVLVGFMQSPQTALWVIGLYMLIQFIESNFITTLIQQKMINMPPALIISAQMTLGALTGSWGLILSTPLTVVVMVLVRKLYIDQRD